MKKQVHTHTQSYNSVRAKPCKKVILLFSPFYHSLFSTSFFYLPVPHSSVEFPGLFLPQSGLEEDIVLYVCVYSRERESM